MVRVVESTNRKSWLDWFKPVLVWLARGMIGLVGLLRGFL